MDSSKKSWWEILIFLGVVVAVMLPYLLRPLAINQDDDIGGQLIQILKLADAKFSFSLDSDKLYINPLTPMIKDHHGPIRYLVLYPVFYLVDIFRVPINEMSVMFVYVAVGLALSLLNFVLIRKLVNRRGALLFLALLLSSPYYVLMMKIGWWQIFSFPSFLAGIFFLDRYLKMEESRIYCYFSLALCAHILSTPTFPFAFLFYTLFIFFYWRSRQLSGREMLSAMRRNFFSRWPTLLPVLLATSLGVISYVGLVRFGGEYTLFSRMLSKGSLSFYDSIGRTVLNVFAHGFGLLGFATFLAILLAVGYLLWQYRKNNLSPLTKTTLIYFIVIFLVLLKLGITTGAYIYELLIPGILLLVFAIKNLKKTFFIFLMLPVVLSSYLQTNLYNLGFTPDNFLSYKLSFLNNYSYACQSLWCPYYFRTAGNFGIKTAGFVLRDYLKISPLPFISKTENFLVRPKEVYFYSSFRQAPSVHLGRRLTWREDEDILDSADVILLFSDDLVSAYPRAVDSTEINQKINDRVANNPRYYRAAIITKSNQPLLSIYKLGTAVATKVFPVEIYDNKFDEKYAHLSDLVSIDLGY